MKTFCHCMFLCLVLLHSGTSLAQKAFDVYFVAVGSGEYAAPPRSAGISDLRGLPPIPGAAQSATGIADLLRRGGARFGVTLVSGPGLFVSRDDIVKAISRVFQEIRKTQPAHPLVVFYFAGHGVADGLTWDHFSLPGNLIYHADAGTAVRNSLAGAANVSVNAQFLVGWLRGAGWPFLVILDTCYEGRPDEFVWKRTVPPAGGAPCKADISGFCGAFERRLSAIRGIDEQMEHAVASLNELAARRRQENRFEKTYPVLFSAPPGATVTTVPRPFQQKPDDLIAPLARRAILIITPALERGEPLTLRQFLQGMASREVDDLADPAVSFSSIPADADRFLTDRPAPKAIVESRTGTATRPLVCCDLDLMRRSPSSPSDR